MNSSRNWLHWKSLWLSMSFVLFLPISAMVQEQENADTAIESSSSAWFEQMDISGSLRSSYQFRNTGGIDDHDLYQYLSLRAVDVWKDRVDLKFSMLWHEDLNGGTRLRTFDNFDPFLDIDQANDNQVRVFTGYADIKDVGFDDSSLQLGRQYFEEIDHIHFDGAAYQFEPYENLEIALFGGVPVAFYSSTSGDAVYGTNISYRFSPQTKAAMRFYRYDANQFNDDLAEIELWHLFSQNVQGHIEFSLLDANPYILQADLLVPLDAMDWNTTFQLVHLFDPVRDHTINFNPVFPLLNSYEPFTRGSVYTIKGLGDYWSITAGVDVLESESTDVVTNNTNRDYQRYSAGVEVYPLKNVTVSVSGEYWDVDPNDQFTGITGEVEYEPHPDWTLSAGLDYGEYVQEFRDEFLFYFGNNAVFRVSPDVITYYSRVRWRPNPKLYSSVWFEVEDSDVDNDKYYTARLEIGIHF